MPPDLVPVPDRLAYMVKYLGQVSANLTVDFYGLGDPTEVLALGSVRDIEEGFAEVTADARSR